MIIHHIFLILAWCWSVSIIIHHMSQLFILCNTQTSFNNHLSHVPSPRMVLKSFNNHSSHVPIVHSIIQTSFNNHSSHVPSPRMVLKSFNNHSSHVPIVNSVHKHLLIIIYHMFLVLEWCWSVSIIIHHMSQLFILLFRPLLIIIHHIFPSPSMVLKSFNNHSSHAPIVNSV